MVDEEAFVAFAQACLADTLCAEGAMPPLSITGRLSAATTAKSFAVVFMSPFTGSFNVGMSKKVRALLEETNTPADVLVLAVPPKTTPLAISRLAQQRAVQPFDFEECRSNYMAHVNMPDCRVLRGAAKTAVAGKGSFEQGKKIGLRDVVARYLDLRRRDLLVTALPTHAGYLKEYRWGMTLDK
jgi:hypothetical protein